MPPQPPLDKNARNIALIVGACFFMVLLDSSIIATSLPRMASSFSVTSVELSIAISVYLLAMAALIPVSAWLADQVGARTIFLVAIAVFTLASAACGMASSLEWFIAFRALQGFGGALMTPVGRMLVLHHTPKNQLAKGLSILITPALTAPVVGPVLGGFITTYFSWQWNFYINVPLGLVATAFVLKRIPKQSPLKLRPFDTLGFVLTSGSLCALISGLELLAHGWGHKVFSITLIGVGLSGGTWAFKYLKTRHNALLDITPLSIPTFAYSSIWAGSFIRIGINAMPFLLPLLFQEILGFSPFEAGGFLLIYFLGNLCTKTITVRALRLFGFRHLLVVSGIICGGFIALPALFSAPVNFWFICPALFFAGVSRSMQYSALNTLSFADINGPQRSSAAALSVLLMQVAMALSIALSALLLNSTQLLADHPSANALDFKIAFCVMGALVSIASVRFLKLPKDAGAEVSGHQANTS